MLGVEDQSFLEAPSRPRKFLAGMVSVTDADVQLDRVRVECKSLAEYFQRLIILAFVVQLVCAFIILLGTQKGCHGRSQPPIDSSCPIAHSEHALVQGTLCPLHRLLTEYSTA